MSADQSAAFREFFAAVYPDAVRFAQRRAPTPEQAEDAVAESMLVAWRRFDVAPSDPGDRRAWLFGIVRNTLLNAARTARRQLAVAVRISDLAPVNAPHDPAQQAAQRVDLVRAWKSLDTSHQEVLGLAVFEELTAPQAARVLGITSVNFRARLSRARRKVRVQLGATVPHAHTLIAQEAKS